MRIISGPGINCGPVALQAVAVTTILKLITDANK